MLTTATHDTKRGEDARVRIDALSEFSEEWAERVKHWERLNRFHRREMDATAPSMNDEYMVYQALVGCWPAIFEHAPEAPSGELASLVSRLQTFVVKAVREAKVMTSWERPNEPYEEACRAFVERMLDASRPNPFLADFADFHALLAPVAMLSGLSQLVLKMTSPGVPDLYQGCESWDLSLVDPDNRRPVDFSALAARLAAIERAPNDGGAHVVDMLAHWRDGRIKQHVTTALLKLRRERPDLFAEGGYEPLECAGPAANQLVAFKRTHPDGDIVVVAGRLFRKLGWQLGNAAVWRDTFVRIPTARCGTWRNVLDGSLVGVRGERECSILEVTRLLSQLPAAVLTAA